MCIATILLSQAEEIQEPQFEDEIETLAKKRRTSSCDTLSMSSRSSLLSLEGQSDPGSTSFTVRLLCM